MKKRDDKPITIVGWGLFPLPGERKQIREDEADSIRKVNQRAEARKSSRTPHAAAVASEKAPAARSASEAPDKPAPPSQAEDERSQIQTGSHPVSGRVIVSTSMGPTGREEVYMFALVLPADKWDDREAVLRALARRIDATPPRLLSAPQQASEKTWTPPDESPDVPRAARG